MMRPRPFTAFSPVALRLGICALIAACVILPVTPPFAAGPISDHSESRTATQADARCSARHWNSDGVCYLPATEAAPAKAVRIITFEARAVSSYGAK